MRKLGIRLAIAIASVGAARAADLPTKGLAAPPVNRFASVWTSLPIDGCSLSPELGPVYSLRHV